MKEKRSLALTTTINLISGVGVLITNVCIAFFLSPYIIRTIGVEANGFVSLANNFVAYADLVVTALNAMAARFITIAYVRKDYEKANLYYNSVFWGNLIIVGILLIPATILIVYLQHIVNVPSNILIDVKILFSIAFLGFFTRTAAPNWDCGTYITNRMDRANVPKIITALFRCVFLFCVFSIWTPHIWYISLSTTLVTLITLAIAGYNTHVLTPKLKITFRPPTCSWFAIKQLVGSGIWSSIAIAGSNLLTSLDLLVCNLMLGATPMGIISLSKSLPDIMTTFSETIRGTFGPELTIAYAKGDQEAILACLRRAMKITSIIVTIPAAGIIVMSDALYHLWIPSQDARLLQILTSLAVLNYIFCSGVVILNNVFTALNKVRINSIAMIVTGAVSIVTTIVFIRFTNFGIFAVAGVSSVAAIIKNMAFMLPVTSILLGFKWNQFYSQVGTSILSSLTIIAIGTLLRHFVVVDSWLMFFLVSAVIGALGLLFNMMIILNKDERTYFINIFRRKFKR